MIHRKSPNKKKPNRTTPHDITLMRLTMTRFLTIIIAASLLCGTTLQAEVLDMRGVVAGEPTLAHHYTFEGDASSRLEDMAGEVDLVEAAYGDGDTAAILYDAGWSAGNTAFTPQRLGSGTTGGAALVGSTITIGGSVTIECLIKTDSVAGGGNGFALVAGKWPNRGYFLFENASSDLGAWVGNGSQVFLDTVPGDWYYLTAVYSQDGANTTIDTYTANLSAGEETLTHTHLTQSGVFGTGEQHLGIGAFATQTGTLQEAFAGSMDEVAIYDGALSASAVQAHFDALLVPEPSAFALLLGLAALAASTRSKRA